MVQRLNSFKASQTKEQKVRIQKAYFSLTLPGVSALFQREGTWEFPSSLTQQQSHL